MDQRSRAYWELHDFSTGRGLEVGPLHRPLVTTDQADVRYVDVLDRDGLVRHYGPDPNVPVDDIPPIDYHLIQDDGRTLSLVEATKAGSPFDWVVASHVIEHVPDVIGWLGELAEVVADDGALVLGIPDRRYCFDVHRPPSTVGQMVAAHYAGDQRPNVATIYDYFSRSVAYDLPGLWSGQMPTFQDRIHTPEETQHHVERTLAGEYVDSHVWLFTPDSFLDQMHELRVTGRSQWVVARIEPTPVHELEFRVVMRRVPRATDATAEQAGEIVSEGEMPDWLEAQMRGLQAELLREQVDRLEQQVGQLKARLAKRARKVQRLRRRVQRQERRLGRFAEAEASPWRLPERVGKRVVRRIRHRSG